MYFDVMFHYIPACCAGHEINTKKMCAQDHHFPSRTKLMSNEEKPAAATAAGAAASAASSNDIAISSTIAFLRTVGRLKHLSRQGWVERGVNPQPPESVGSHMWRMGVICAFCPYKEFGLDRDRMVRMALVHDACETIVGDITPAMKVDKAAKKTAEMKAVREVLMPLLPGDCGSAEFADLFAEYEDDETPEAHFVHDVDLLDMIIQCLDYQIASPDVDLSCFTTAGARIRHPWVKALSDHVVAVFRGEAKAAPLAPPQFLGEQVVVNAKRELPKKNSDE